MPAWSRFGAVALALAALAPTATADASSGASPAELAKKPDARTAVLEVKGVSCAGCASRLRKALEAHDGVIEVRSGEPKTRVEVDFDRSKTGPEAVSAAARDAGFENHVVSVRRPGS